MHTRITEAHIRSVAVMDSFVTASARCTVDHLELDAECSIDMRPNGMDDGTPEITDAEIEIATRQAVSGVIGKLQAVVAGRFARADIKFEETAAGKTRSAAVGEKAAARPLSECDAVERVLPWTERTEIRAEDLPKGIVFLCGRLDTLESDIRRLVGQRLPIIRYVEIAGTGVGWKIGHECLPIENAIGLTTYELDRHIKGMIGRQDEGDPDQIWANRINPVYQRYFGAMGVSIPDRLKIDYLEAKIRKLVDGRTTWTRQLRCEPGWHIGGEFLSLEKSLQLSERAFENRIRGIVCART